MVTAAMKQVKMKTASPASSLDPYRIKQDFPVLQQQSNGRPLVYLDSANTSQKPQCVIDAINKFYAHDNANIHRGVYDLSIRATKAYENARGTIAKFVGASRPEEIIFVRGTTEAINLVAQTFVRNRVGQGDEILVTAMEHHSNIVPWQIVCQQTGAVLKVAPINDAGEIILDAYREKLTAKTKFVAMTHVSNALGTVNPIAKMIELAHEKDIPVLVDGAQAAPHIPINVSELGCDFYTVSSHKMFGPTGVGALYGRLDLLNAMPPYQGGGDMILSVTFEHTTYNEVPYKFEAGTPHIAGAIGFAAAAQYILDIGFDKLIAYEHELLDYATKSLATIPEVRMIGTAAEKVSVLSFVLDGVHPHDVGTILDQQGIAIRTGHHCAQPIMDRFDVPATIRASLAIYNTKEDIDALAASLKNVMEVFR